MRIEWSGKGRSSYDALLPSVQKQCDRALQRLSSHRSSQDSLNMKKLRQTGTLELYSIRVSREIRGILQRIEGGFLIIEFTRRSNRRYYSTE